MMLVAIGPPLSLLIVSSRPIVGFGVLGVIVVIEGVAIAVVIVVVAVVGEAIGDTSGLCDDVDTIGGADVGGG